MLSLSDTSSVVQDLIYTYWGCVNGSDHPNTSRWHLFSDNSLMLHMISIKLRGFCCESLTALVRPKSKWVWCLFLMCGRTAAIYSSVCPGLSFWSPWCCFSLLAVKSNTTAINSFPAFIYQQPAGIVAPEMNVITAISTQHKCCLTVVGTQTMWFLLSDAQRSLIQETEVSLVFGGFLWSRCWTFALPLKLLWMGSDLD